MSGTGGTFDEACASLQEVLTGSARREMVAELSRSRDLGRALLRLRDRMHTHAWTTASGEISLARFIRKFDAQTRQEGFHALNDWDGKADRVSDEIIPVDVLTYLVLRRGEEATDPAVLSMLVDYYFMHVLSLLTLRLWDEGDADENLARVNALLADLQGPEGSGQRFVTDAETLMLLATSHFELVERGYEILLQRVRSLTRAHQLNIALGHAASMGSHLRSGLKRPTGATRSRCAATTSPTTRGSAMP
jgi:hypothetical protein